MHAPLYKMQIKNHKKEQITKKNEVLSLLSFPVVTLVLLTMDISVYENKFSKLIRVHTGLYPDRYMLSNGILQVKRIKNRQTCTIWKKTPI